MLKVVFETPSETLQDKFGTHKLMKNHVFAGA